MSLIVVMGGYLVSGGSVEIGVMIAFLLYVQRFFDPIRALTMHYSTLQRAMASGHRIFELLDIEIDRNAYGRQVFSFSDKIQVIDGKNKSLCEVLFIRAPKIISVGNDCSVFAIRNDEIIGVRQGKHFAITCHPELMHETKIHEMCFKSN